MSDGGQESVLQSLTRENNKLMKTYMYDLLQGRLADTIQGHLQCLERVLMKLQGLPPENAVVELEAVTLYNSGVAMLHCNCLEKSSHVDDEIELKLKKLLTRVGFQKRGDSLEEYLHKDGSKRFQNHHILAVLLVYAMNIFLSKNLKSSLSVLQFVCRSLPRIKDSEGDSILTFPVEGLLSGAIPNFKSQQLTELSSSAHLAMSLTSAKMCQYSTALSHLQQVTLQNYADHIALIEGYCLYQQGKYSDAFSLISIRGEEISKSMKSIFCYLKALCFYKQHKVELAIQQLRRCLVEDFVGQTSALYLLSQLFDSLGMKNVLIETLQLLVTKLKQEEKNEEKQQKHIPQMTLNCFMFSLFGENVTLNEALYCLGKTCFQSGRFEAAGKAYLELVKYLLNSGMEYMQENERIVDFSPVATIFVEAAGALVKSNRPKEAIAVCNHLLNKSSDESGGSKNSTQIRVQKESLLKLKKRQLSETELETSAAEDPSIQTVIPMLKLKAEALLMLGDTESSLQCVNSCLRFYEDYCDKCGNGLETEHQSPPRKFQKLDEGCASEKRDAGQPVDYVMSDVYACMARILVVQNNHQMALHWSRMALNSTPDTTNDKTVSRQDFLELLKKVQVLRNWPTGCPGYALAERIIAKVWTAFQKGNRKYRNKDSQMHIRDHEWRRYWGDFVEAARAASGWPEHSVDGDVNYEWQKDYMNFMFNLMDTNGDGGLDRREYLKCFTSFGLSPEDCHTAFDKFAVDSYGRPLEEVDINRFEELWFQYLTSDDLSAHPGNFLMGKLDLEQHAPSHYPMDQTVFVQSAPNDQVRRGPEQPKVMGVKPSSVTMVYGQITGGGARLSNVDDDQIYDPSRRRYQNDPGVDVGGVRGPRGPQQRQGPPPGRQQQQQQQQQPKYGGGPGGPMGQMGSSYGSAPQRNAGPARQDSTGKPLQIKVNSVANPDMGPPVAPPAAQTSLQNTPVNYSSHGQISLQQQQQQQQQQRQISATSNSSATAPTIAAFNCTVEDGPTNAGYSRGRPGQQMPGSAPAAARSTATFNNPNKQQPAQYGQANVGGNQPSSFGQSYGPDKSYSAGPRSHGQVRMPTKNPGRRQAPFVAQPAKPGPPPPGGPNRGRPLYSDF